MSLPGRPLPGLFAPGAAHPGYESPGYPTTPTLSAEDVDTDATGTTDLGTVSGDRDVVLSVSVDADETDFDFQVTVGGDSVFDGEQSPSETGGEVFVPSRDEAVYRGAGDEDVVFEITSDGSAGSADVDVEFTSEEYV